MPSWVQNNWFKVGVVAALIFGAYGYYQSAVVIPREKILAEQVSAHEKADAEATKQALAAAAAKAQEEERQNQLDSCLADAQSNYTYNWNGTCKSLGKLSARCEIITIGSGSFLEKFNQYKEWHPNATFSEFTQAKEDCSCLLSTSQADRWDSALKGDQQMCYQKFK